MTHTSFVALGDSFTEGLEDLGSDGRYRGWADLVAASLAARTPGFRYANLAVRGRVLGQIVEEQVEVAVGLAPSLVSIAGGGNDILRPGCDPQALGRTFHGAVTRLAATGATVLAFAGFAPYRLPMGRRLSARAARFNAAVRSSVAATPGAVLADLWAMPVLADERMWAPDRLHLSSEGHRRVAAMVLEQLGEQPELDWREPLPARLAPAWHERRRDDAEWVRRHLTPWVARRVRGRSSGDDVLPKHTGLTEVDVQSG